MGVKLMQYYKYVSDEKGLSGQMALAKATKVPSTKAALEPDSLMAIELFMQAVEMITGKPAPKY
jgi:hypothetical protein